MKHFIIYHNPRCSKSRQTLDLLKQEGINPKIVLYIEEPPSESDLTKILDFLGIEPRELLRTGEVEYKELILKDKTCKDVTLDWVGKVDLCTMRSEVRAELVVWL